LQAADLISYVSRQYIEKIFKNEERRVPDARVLDLILLRNRSEQLRKLKVQEWRRFVAIIRKHQIETTKDWKLKGISETYLPDKHFPFEKYGNNDV
jgi:hypothetical protein